MRRLTIVYTAVGIWLHGWLSGQFGFGPSSVVGIIYFLPAVFAWKTIVSGRTFQRREIAYFAIAAALCASATAFAVARMYDDGMDRKAWLTREVQKLRGHISTMPEYSNVEIKKFHGKGDCVLLEGSVAGKNTHERLMQYARNMIRNGDGFLDYVSYPGKPVERRSRLSPHFETEPIGKAE